MSAEALARAQALEAEGDADGAAREYLAAGAHQEAARVFTLAFRPLDAAIALLSGIEMISADLDSEPRARAQLAASLLREGGRDDYAKLVLGAIGGGTSFPSAVLKSVLTAPAPSAAPRTVRPAAPSVAPEARRSGSFVVRAPVSTAAPPRTSVPPAQPAPVSAPRAATSSGTGLTRPATSAAAPATSSAPGMPRPSVAPATATAATPPAAAPAPEAERYKAEAGWHAADGAAIEETIRQFLATGRKGAAARVAWEAGQFERALEWFVELGLKYQAGSCLRSLNRPAEALATFLELPEDDTRYRRACFEIVALARETKRLDFEVDRFLTTFVSEGPKEPDECAGFLDLADLYAEAGSLAGARRCAESVLRLRPEDARAKALVARAAASARPAPGSDRPVRTAAGDLTVLPTLDEFVALARKHMPPRPSAKK